MDGALATARRIAESLMVDECRIERPADGPGPWDPVAGQHLPAPPTVVYPPPGARGICEVQRRALVGDARPSAGDRTATVETVEVKIPATASGVDVGDVVVMEASRDPALVGRRLQVQSDPAKTHAAARRLRCSEVTG